MYCTSTGLVANGDDLGCGCFAAGELEYWSDIDSDSWGSGTVDCSVLNSRYYDR